MDQVDTGGLMYKQLRKYINVIVSDAFFIIIFQSNLAANVCLLAFV